MFNESRCFAFGLVCQFSIESGLPFRTLCFLSYALCFLSYALCFLSYALCFALCFFSSRTSFLFIQSTVIARFLHVGLLSWENCKLYVFCVSPTLLERSELQKKKYTLHPRECQTFSSVAPADSKYYFKYLCMSSINLYLKPTYSATSIATLITRCSGYCLNCSTRKYIPITYVPYASR